MIKKIILSWDFGYAFVIFISSVILLPSHVNGIFAISVYNTGLTILSIIFSIFFASLAIIISVSDNDFVSFLEEEGQYTAIINTFKYTLTVLFVGLIISIILFLVCSYYYTDNNLYYPHSKWIFCTYLFLFFYSLFCTFISSKDSISYSKFRALFIQTLKDNAQKSNDKKTD